MPDTTQLHAAQIAYWNGAGGERWLAQRDRREKTRTAFADSLITRAAAAPGEVVLDVGCGLGDTSVALAEAVGPDGRVTALDVSAQLLEVARARLTPYPWADAVLADAATHEFPTGSVDLLFSRFGVMFFGDPVAAFANMRRALKPDGRFVFACWRQNMAMTAIEAVHDHIPDLPRQDPDAPGPLAFAREERLIGILTQAGFAASHLECVELTIDSAAGEGLDAAVAQTLQTGPAQRLLGSQSDAVKAEAAVAVRKALAPYQDGGTVNLPAAFWIVSVVHA